MNCVTAGNVMVQLFLQTQPKYHLNNKKLQYLLCIAQLASLRCGKVLFDETIRNMKSGFALEKIADSFFSHSAIQEGGWADKTLKKSWDEFKIPFTTKKIYSFNEELIDEEKKLLIFVFIKFGTYKEETLCSFLNGFSSLRDLPIWEDISNDFILDFFKRTDTEGLVDESNEVFRFCNAYHSHINKEVEKAEKVIVSDETKSEKNKILDEVKVDVAPAVVPVVKKDVLKEYLSATSQVCCVGKKYSVYVETFPDKPVKDVVVIALYNNKRVKGVLKKVNDTLFCYSFAGVPSNVKISVDF